MIRIVSDFVPEPKLMVLCDVPTCGMYALQDFPVEGGRPIPVGKALEAFIHGRILEGWALAPHQHVCPSHMAKHQQQQKLVQVPSLILNN